MAPSPTRAGTARVPEARTESSSTPVSSLISGRVAPRGARGIWPDARPSSLPSVPRVPAPVTKPSRFAASRNSASENPPCAQRIWMGLALSHVSPATAMRTGSIETTPSPRHGSASGTRAGARAEVGPLAPAGGRGSGAPSRDRAADLGDIQPERAREARQVDVRDRRLGVEGAGRIDASAVERLQARLGEGGFGAGV